MKWESAQRDVPVLEVLGEAVVVGHARVIRRLLVVVGAQWRTVGRGLDALGANSCREERRCREKEREGPKAAWHVVEPNAASDVVPRSASSVVVFPVTHSICYRLAA